MSQVLFLALVPALMEAVVQVQAALPAPVPAHVVLALLQLQQPVLAPGDCFEYTSGCPLGTPSGFMVGSYQMTDEKGELFDVAIPAFSLDSPFVVRSMN